MKKILLVENDNDYRHVLSRFLFRHMFDVATAECLESALNILEKLRPDTIVLGYPSKSADFQSRFDALRQMHPNIPVIVFSDDDEVRVAINLFKKGAIDYLVKPFLPEQLLASIRQVFSRKTKNTQEEKVMYTQQTSTPCAVFLGDAPAMKEIRSQIDLAAPTSYSILISGESGSGKEVVAREIHHCSKRRTNPFVAVDCGCFTPEMAGSELFGHVKGAFTGAADDKTGLIEKADKGTLFLDEIGNLPYETQTSLLRVLQERKIRKIGSTQETTVDVRIICASNDDLWQRSLDGRFRHDLFHRLNEFRIHVPPLRERKEDIPYFASVFLEKVLADLKKPVLGILPEVMTMLKKYSWPGNLRELNNCIKRMALLCQGPYIDLSVLPEYVTEGEAEPRSAVYQPTGVLPSTPPENISLPEVPESRPDMDLKRHYERAELEIIQKALEKFNYNKSKTAEYLKISRRTLYNKLGNLYARTQKGGSAQDGSGS